MTLKLDEKKLSDQIERQTEAAIKALAPVISDDSRYLIFQWASLSGSLKVGLANYDNKHQVNWLSEVNYPELSYDRESNNDSGFSLEVEELLRFWLTDYLSTCGGFFRYALIALFHTGDASKARLL